jgi:hypothetical protein
MYIVTNALGVRRFKREDDAYDYAIQVIRQTGQKSEITKENDNG